MRRLIAAAFTLIALLAPLSHPSEARSASSRSGWDTCVRAIGPRVPVGTGECPGVRPGAVHWTTEGQCTFNFLFVDTGGSSYIGSAGHCALGAPAERVWREGRGPTVLDGAGKPIGEFAYAHYDGAPRGPDFALVRLKRGTKADAQMCFFGGPTGINDDLTEDPVFLRWYGNGGLIGYEPTVGVHTLPARSAIAPEGMDDPDFADAIGPVFFGDSGSGVTSDDGRAVGVAVTLQFSRYMMGISRLAPQLQRAEVKLGIELTLQTAPTLPRPN